MREQNLAFAIEAVRKEPLRQLAGSLSNVLRLLLLSRATAFGSDVTFTYASSVGLRDWVGINVVVDRLPNRDECARDPTARCGQISVAAVKWLHYAVVTLAMLVLGLAAIRLVITHGLDVSRLGGPELFALMLCIGIVANATVCGVLGGPFSRFQLRVSWLLPMLVLAYPLFDLTRVGRHELRRAAQPLRRLFSA